MFRLKSPYHWSLGQKLSVIIALLVFSVAFSISFFVLRQERTALEGELKKRGVEMVHDLSELSANLVLHEKIWDLYTLVKDLVRRGSANQEERVMVYAMVLNKEGVLLSHSDPLHFEIGEPLEKNSVNYNVLQAEDLFIQTIRSEEGYLLYDLAIPIVMDNVKIGVARIGITTRYLEKTIANVKRDILLMSTLLAIMGAIFGLIISRRMARPLKNLTESARAISQGRMDEVSLISTKGKDEMGILTETFNSMARNLKDHIKELKETKKFLWSVLESANDVIYMVDKKGVFTFLNQEIEEFGYEKNELIGRPFLSILTEKHKGERFIKTMEQGVKLSYEIEMRCKDGEVRNAILSTSPLKDGEDKIIGVLGIVRDITERKRTEDKLLRESQKLDDIVKGIGGGLTIVDKDMNIVWVNKTIEEWYGPFKKIRGESCYKTFMGRDEVCDDCPTEMSLKTGEIAHGFEKRFTEKGEEREFYITSAPIRDEKGRIVQALELVQDVTEKRRLERELVKAENLAMVGEIAAGVAHEIRNPLGSIVTASHLLSSDGIRTKDERSTLLTVLKTESGRLNKILTDFLNFARPREPKFEMNNINLLIEEVLNLSRFGNNLKDGIKVKKNLGTKMIAIPLDGGQIKQVLWNIVLNAIQAMENGGDLKVTSKLFEKDVQVIITDNGIGIPEEDLDKIFIPFYTRKKDGSGLGLSLAHRIINAHRGNIKVDSLKEGGTRFTITLPTSVDN